MKRKSRRERIAESRIEKIPISDRALTLLAVVTVILIIGISAPLVYYVTNPGR